MTLDARPVYHRCPPDGGDCYAEIEVASFEQPETQYIPGACRHARTVPVESATGETLASLCLCCDRQLPVRA